MTRKDRIIIRDYLNSFSDRFPEEYHRMYVKFKHDPIQFEISVLWEMLNLDWTIEESLEIWGMVDILRDFRKECHSELLSSYDMETQQKRSKTKISIEDISDGSL